MKCAHCKKTLVTKHLTFTVRGVIKHFCNMQCFFAWKNKHGWSK